MILGRHRRIHLVVHALPESVLVVFAMTVFLLLLRRLFLIVRRRVLPLGLFVAVPMGGGTRVVRVLGRGRGGGVGRITVSTECLARI